MFKDTKAFSGFSVNDTQQAKKFYGETLGLNITDAQMDTLKLNIEGGTTIIIYPKGADHRPASFTILNFPVEDIDIAVDTLKAKGIVMEQYGEMGTDEKGIFRGADKGQGPNIAWFKDPAGNILSILEMK